MFRQVAGEVFADKSCKKRARVKTGALMSKKLNRGNSEVTSRLALKKERLALDREKVIRSEIEYIVKVCNLPDLREIAEDDELDFTQKIRCIRKILHGEPKEQAVVEPIQRFNNLRPAHFKRPMIRL